MIAVISARRAADQTDGPDVGALTLERGDQAGRVAVVADLGFVGDQFVGDDAALDRVRKCDLTALWKVFLPDLLFFIHDTKPSLRPVRSHSDVDVDRFALELLTIGKVPPWEPKRAHAGASNAGGGANEKLAATKPRGGTK